MKVEFEIGNDQIDGARDYQEDAFMASQLGETPAGNSAALIIMADGMGGHAAGNVASNMAVATFNKSFQSNFPPQHPDQALHNALSKSNDQIRSAVKEAPALSGMGCTMVTAYIEDANLWWVSVGDSHLYLIREKELIKQNADHSYGAFLDMMMEQGEAIEEQAGMSRNMLMSAMTGAEISSIDCPESPIKVKPGDRIIIASDGLDTIGAGAIIQHSVWSKTAKECVYALLKAVEDVKRKNQDNTTIIVVDVKEKEDKPSAELQLKEEMQKAASQQRLNDIEVEEEEEEPKSNSVISIIILLLLIGGGYFAWSTGLIDRGMAEISKLITKDVAPSYEAPAYEPEIVTPPKQPTPDVDDVVEKPKPKPQLKAPVYSAPRKPPSATDKPVIKASKPFKDKLAIGGTAPSMVKIQAGTFKMGSATATLSTDESPRHEVSVKAFALSTHEVTFAEYEIFALATEKELPKSSGRNKEKHPVTFVSWDDAIEYTQWLSEQTGKQYRLPSEAEWEYAARAGTISSYWWGRKKGAANAHCFDCNSGLDPNKPALVGSFKPNPFGLYDMNGNVYE